MDKIIQIISKGEDLYGISEHGDLYIYNDNLGYGNRWELKERSPKLAEQEERVG